MLDWEENHLGLAAVDVHDMAKHQNHRGEYQVTVT